MMKKSVASASDVGQKLLARAEEWPDTWRYTEDDLPLGREILSAMMPFLENLVERGLARTTLRRHFGFAWVLGGEILREAAFRPELRNMNGRAILFEFIGEDGGPLSRHLTEEEHRSFDTTCRQLFLFLTEGGAVGRKGRRRG